MDGCGRYLEIRGGIQYEARENYIIRSFMICTPHKIFLGGQIKEWMGGACGIWGRNEMHTGFWWVNLKKRDNLQDLGVDGSIKLKYWSQIHIMGGCGLDSAG